MADHDHDDDDEIALEYREAELGKNVWIKFPVTIEDKHDFQFFKGKITKMEVYYPDNDTDKKLEYRHYVFFGDEDDGYYNLTEQEMTGYLKWTQEEADEATSAAAATATTTSTATAAAAPRAVTPEKKSDRKRAATPNARSNATTATPSKKVKVKQEVGSAISNIEDPTNQNINLNEFSSWLRKIHLGTGGSPISEANARSVMNRVRDLISGDGVMYRHWVEKDKDGNPVKVSGKEIQYPFRRGQTITLDTDFERLLKDAKAHEMRYGKDKGNGWALQHPIKKMLLFKQHVNEKRNQRKNPIPIS